MERKLSERDYVSIWVDGVHFNVRLEEQRLCCLVLVGVRLDGKKEPVGIATATGSRPTPGRRFFVTCDLKACGHLSSPPATVRSGAGQRFATSSPRPRSSATGWPRGSADMEWCQ